MYFLGYIKIKQPNNKEFWVKSKKVLFFLEKYGKYFFQFYKNTDFKDLNQNSHRSLSTTLKINHLQ